MFFSHVTMSVQRLAQCAPDMCTERFVKILSLMAQRERTGSHNGILCSVAAEIVGVSGASIVLEPTPGQFTILCASNQVASQLVDLEIMLGEGPCVDACGSSEAIIASILDSSPSRWLAYAPLAVALGATSVFSFPVNIGAVRFGALNLFRAEARELSDDQISDGYLMASVVARSVLAMQAGLPHGSLTQELGRDAIFDFSVHQAAGMVAEQGSLSIGDALVALRSHAFATNRPLGDLAQRVVARESSFDPGSGSWRHGALGAH